jgi:hypothetical protein
MIVTENDLKKYIMICHCCNKRMEVGQSYEKITTHSKSKLVLHTECIKKG